TGRGPCPLQHLNEEQNRKCAGIRTLSAKARTKFEKLDLDKQLDVLGMIVVALHADPGRANLSLVGLPSEWKRVRSVSFSDDDEFVFQSPSGLFETKITIAELKKAE
uniref:Cas9 endonuclease PAM-interacting domain-containing protein n=1 Tax=Bifidobacterium adolescentis TaxID=1680 RepID=UPI0034A182CE